MLFICKNTAKKKNVRPGNMYQFCVDKKLKKLFPVKEGSKKKNSQKIPEISTDICMLTEMVMLFVMYSNIDKYAFRLNFFFFAIG